MEPSSSVPSASSLSAAARPESCEQLVERCCRCLGEPVSAGATFFTYHGQVAFLSDARRIGLEPARFAPALERAQQEVSHMPALVPVRALQLLGYQGTVSQQINIVAARLIPDATAAGYLIRHLSIDIPACSIDTVESQVLERALGVELWKALQSEIGKAQKEMSDSDHTTASRYAVMQRLATAVEAHADARSAGR